MGGKENKKRGGKKEKGKRKKKGKWSKKEGNYPYFVSQFSIGPLMSAKKQKEFQKITMGGGRFFRVANIFNLVIDLENLKLLSKEWSQYSIYVCTMYST